MPKPHAAIVRSRLALGWTQKQFGETLGSSARTAARWENGSSHFDSARVTTLARHVYRVNRDLAIELASSIGQTLVGLGIEAPPPPPAPPAAPPPPAAPVAPPLPPVLPTSPRDLIDSIVCSVADAANMVPRAVRPLVLLALRRAVEVRLDLVAAEQAELFDGAASVEGKSAVVTAGADEAAIPG
jgi:transcriptional regulator with XRE-family HTH domain